MKFIIDFDSQKLEYTKRYESEAEFPPEPRVDCGMKYLIMRLTKSHSQPCEAIHGEAGLGGLEDLSHTVLHLVVGDRAPVGGLTVCDGLH